MIPNTSQKLFVLEKYGSGCTVVARPLFLRLVFWLFLCDTTLWASVTVVWTTWNLDRMCARYSYLKLTFFFFKIFFPKSFFNFFSKKKFFFKKIFLNLIFPFFLQEMSLILLFKNHFWPKIFLLVLRLIWRPGSIVYLSC